MIYLITKGVYDDFEVVGYVKTEAEAIKIMNAKNEGRKYDRYDYEECEEL